MDGTYEVGRQNYNALRTVMDLVNSRFKIDFDIKFCFARFRKLKLRYKLFKWITHLNGVMHDLITNCVECCDDGWEFIYEKEPLARAYMLVGEKSWDGLRILFQEVPDSPEFIVPVDSVEVIELSSDHEGDNGGDSHMKKGNEVCRCTTKKRQTLLARKGSPTMSGGLTWLQEVIPSIFLMTRLANCRSSHPQRC